VGDLTSGAASGRTGGAAEHVRQKALQALAEVGDGGSVQELRDRRKDAQWSRMLQRAFYDMSEEIGLREYEKAQWSLSKG
jgi:hypothetical protein